MKNKKVLIVAYYWPPAGGPGVQRWLKFAKYLPEFGIQPVMFVPQNPSYPIVDEKLPADIDPELKIYRGPIWEPYAISGKLSKKTASLSSGIIPEAAKATFLEKAALWIRGNLFIPDARLFWVGPSVSRIGKILREENIDTVITTGPPHSVHLIGLELQKRAGVKWIADFRDPWTSIGYHSKLMLTNFAQKRHKQLEFAILSSANRVIATSRTTAREFQSIGAANPAVITNGFDPHELPPPKLDRAFSIAHIGSLLSGRNPLNLWRALAELCEEVPGFGDDLKLHLIGTVSQDVVVSIASAGLEPNLEITRYIPHDQAIQMQRSAQILLLIEIDSPETRGILPGKLFEYIASGRPVIALGPQDSEISDVIGQTKSGEFFTYKEEHKIKAHIKSLYASYKSGKLMSEAIGTERFTRRATAQKLANLIRGLWE